MTFLASMAFVLDPDYAASVRGTLLPRLGFRADGAPAMRAVLYDTVDWRLWSAGQALLTDADHVLLHPLAGERPPLALKLPADGLFAADSLPPGVLRHRLCGLIGAAGLLPVVVIEAEAERFVHRDADGKIDCRATLMRLAVDGARPLPPLLLPQPLRGYRAAARGLVAAMAEGLAPAPEPRERLRVLLHAGGRTPGDTSPPDAELSPQMPAGRGVARCLRQALATIQDRAPRVLADRDLEHLHQFRVAVRQSRALLKAMGPMLPAKCEARGRKGLRWLGRLSTPVRDLDVLLAGEAQAFSDALQQHLRARRAADFDGLAAGLRSDRFAAFSTKWRRSLARVPEDGPPLRQAADAALLAAADRFIADAAAVREDCPAAALHELRKDGKQLRYLLDFFRELYPPKGVKALLRPLKVAQDQLGLYQDLAVHQSLLQPFQEAAPMLRLLAAQEAGRRHAAVAALQPFQDPAARDAYRAMTEEGA